MANYTITTNAGQESVLDTLLPWVNQRRTAVGKSTYADKAAMVQGEGLEHFQDLFSKYKMEKRGQTMGAYDGASQSVKDQVHTLLGI